MYVRPSKQLAWLDRVAENGRRQGPGGIVTIVRTLDLTLSEGTGIELQGFHGSLAPRETPISRCDQRVQRGRISKRELRLLGPGHTWCSFSFRCSVEFRDCSSSYLELTEFISISLLQGKV